MQAKKLLLELLRWVEEWKDACTVNGKSIGISFDTRNNISMQYICYGFDAMFYELAIQKDRVIAFRRINQDVCEWHFSHIRATCGCHDNLTEVTCNNSDLVAYLVRQIDGGVSGSNVEQGEIEATKKRKGSGQKSRPRKQRLAV